MRLREILRAKQLKSEQEATSQQSMASSAVHSDGATTSSNLRSSANGGSRKGGWGPHSPTPSESPPSSSSASVDADQIVDYLRSVVGYDEANRLMRSCVGMSPVDAMKSIAEAVGSIEGKRQKPVWQPSSCT